MSNERAGTTDTWYVLTTSTAAGAIALIQLHGSECCKVLHGVTGVIDWPVAHMKLVQFAGVDEGLAVRVSENSAQLMPHGGPRVVQRVSLRLRELGVAPLEHDEPRAMYPEAVDEVEALMLATLARAASRLAIEPLLAQPALWRAHAMTTMANLIDSKSLKHLISPPLVVLAGLPNVGKSTLSNSLVGRNMSISLDLPGTTRDYTVAQLDLAGLVVHWHDTPGIRTTTDPIESRAIELSQGLMERADLLIALSDAQHDWPPLPRQADLRVANKADLAPRNDADLNISAATGKGISELVERIRDTLVPPEVLSGAQTRPWLFDSRLKERTTYAVGEDVP